MPSHMPLSSVAALACITLATNKEYKNVSSLSNTYGLAHNHQKNLFNPNSTISAHVRPYGTSPGTNHEDHMEQCTMDGCHQSLLTFSTRKTILQQSWTSQLHWQFDCMIMDDIANFHLPRQNVTQLNNMWMYLCINMLLEMANHSGTHLLPQMLQATAIQDTMFHQHPNHSKLSWPAQDKLSAVAWQNGTKW